MPVNSKKKRDAGRETSTPPAPKRNGPKRLSEFAADAWHYEPDVRDARDPYPLDWTFGFPDEARLPSSKWRPLVDQGRYFIASLEKENRGGKPLKLASLRMIHGHLRYLLLWMAREGHASFSELVPDVAEDFLAYLARDKVSGEDVDEADAAALETVAGYLEVLCRIYRQRFLLNLGPGPAAVVVEHPFGGRTAYEMAGTVARLGDGWIEPVPEDVWIPTVRAAIEWLDRNGANVARLGEIVVATIRDHSDPFNLPDDGSFWRAIHLQDLQFPLEAWLNMEPDRRGRRAVQEAGEEAAARGRSVTGLYRSLLADLRDAGTIVLQAMVGLRIGEVVGLNAGHGLDGSHWPSCLEIGLSRSGLDEIFYVRGRVFKLRPSPEDVTWVAGSRPVGSGHIPAAARAILALEAAFRPWRNLGGREALIVSLGREALPTYRYGVDAVRAQTLAQGQRRFMLAHAELPAHRRDVPLSSHQWRKSFAINVVKADGRLLAAVGDHFKHLSIAMTEQGYIGRDPALLGLVDDMGVREAARMLFEAVTGTTVLTGRMADVVAKNADDIVLLGGGGSDDERIERIEDALRHDDLRVWPSDWGQCLFRPETSKCHHGRKPEDLVPSRPDYEYRHPGVCCGCANLLVTDRHVGFWRERRDANLAAADEMDRKGEALAAETARKRARKAAVHVDRYARTAEGNSKS